MRNDVCPKCGVVHFELRYYAEWIKRFDNPNATPKLKAQIVRWQAIVDKHTRKLKLEKE